MHCENGGSAGGGCSRASEPLGGGPLGHPPPHLPPEGNGALAGTLQPLRAREPARAFSARRPPAAGALARGPTVTGRRWSCLCGLGFAFSGAAPLALVTFPPTFSLLPLRAQSPPRRQTPLQTQRSRQLRVGLFENVYFLILFPFWKRTKKASVFPMRGVAGRPGTCTCSRSREETLGPAEARDCEARAKLTGELF